MAASYALSKSTKTAKQNAVDLADRLDATDCAEEDEDPGKQETEDKIPLDGVCVHVYAVRYCKDFVPVHRRQTSQHALLSNTKQLRRS